MGQCSVLLSISAGALLTISLAGCGGFGNGAEGQEVLEQYPTIQWDEEAYASASGDVLPLADDCYSWRHLRFTATFQGESHAFDVGTVVQYTWGLPGFGFSFFSAETHGAPISFFDHHELRVTLRYSHDGGATTDIVRSTTYGPDLPALWCYPSLGADPEWIPEHVIDLVDGALVGEPTTYGTLFAIKEMRFVAPDGVTYYTWTNPGV